MNFKIYPRLAMNSIKKNKRLYIPYILTCIGMVMMFYIVSFLTYNGTLLDMPGGDIMYTCLHLGCCVIAVFALIFLFYTNSFLIRRRKKEFGLYNILGMGKANLAVVLVWESLIILMISLAGGLFSGILFSKFAELAMINILRGETTFTLNIEWQSVKITAAVFAAIFLLLLINTLYQIRLTKPIDLLKSENMGEKPPKANILLAIGGVILLAVAYYMAVTIENPINALLLFFVAVIMVIIATYILFIVGSVTICKILQKNKNYYYKTNHFVSVSSMSYRMKRNGAGLASICILCTMVLVTISTTVGMYLGAEDSIRERYPKNIGINISANELSDLKSNEIEDICNRSFKTATEYGQTPQNLFSYSYAGFTAVFDEGKITNDPSANYMSTKEIYIISLNDYNKLMNENKTLAANEVFVFITADMKYKGDTISIKDERTYKIKEHLSDFVFCGKYVDSITPSVFIITNDIEKTVEPIAESESTENKLIHWYLYYGYDLDCDDETQIEVKKNFSQYLHTAMDKSEIITSESCESEAEERIGFYSLYGSLYFLGILLGTVFVFAAVLIIYYKQISEGYEDQSRFEIMQKVGMNQREIRKSINSQILTVFFLPLMTAALHLTFAFPMIRKMLLLFGITNLTLLITVTICCFAVFSVFYIFVYRITSKAYYSIVSKAK